MAALRQWNTENRTEAHALLREPRTAAPIASAEKSGKTRRKIRGAKRSKAHRLEQPTDDSSAADHSDAA
jgi:hypothetical protein